MTDELNKLKEELHKEREELGKAHDELNKSRSELNVLYETSNAMRTTLKLDEILYIILTGVTAHLGLGFNRAMLFLVNDREGIIEGKMGIGPDTGEEANKIWKHIEMEQMDLDDLINTYKASGRMVESHFNQQVKNIKIAIKEHTGGLLALEVMDGMPLHLKGETINNYRNDPILGLLKTDEIAVVPLKAKDKVNGIILADNIYTKKPISKDDMRMLIMLANEAGLAIENSRLYEQTVIRSHSDSLTGLWNHGYFQFTLQTELERAKATNTPITLVMVDIDDFKKYNDTFGHQAGDQILKGVAKLLKDYSRKMDWVCRYGGEEFTIILPQTSKKEAIIIAERLREAVEKHPFINEEVMPNKKLTVSLGVSTYPEDGSTNAELISYSDKSLYQAKNQGKNQTWA